MKLSEQHGRTVYLEKRDDIDVVVKKFDYDSNDPDIKKQIKVNLKEIEAIKTLQHPNIVQYISSSGHSELVMEYGGDSLSDCIEKGIRYKFKVSLCAQMLEGIIYMHSVGFIHRDIKPQNMVVENNHLKLCDFGSVGRMKPNAKRWLGYTTIPYRAPELFFDFDNYNEKIDVWAAACVIYEVFHEERLFKGIRHYTICKSMISRFYNSDWPEAEKSYWYEEVTQNIKYKPTDLILPIGKMLQINPSKRCTSTEALEIYKKGIRIPLMSSN